jgi:glycosyltransferase involved in cell wall biosynthesis
MALRERPGAELGEAVSVRIAVLAATVLPWHRPGGLERHVLHLCRWLRRRQIAVDLFLSRPEVAADPFAGDSGFRLHVVEGTPFLRRRYMVVLSRNTLYPLFSLRMGRRVAAEHRRAPYSAVIAQGMTGLGYALCGASAPLLLNPQGMEEAVTPNLVKYALYAPFRTLIRTAARRAAVVVATDRVLTRKVETILRVPRERVLVIPNAIDVTECLALADVERGRRVAEELGVARATPLVVTIGRLEANKGFEVAIEALARLVSRLPPSWRCVVIGDGPLRADLDEETRRRGLGERIRFAGGLSDADMHSLLARADLFLNPTIYEGSSLVTLEAMSHGRCVVASRAGGIPDKIEEGVTGWLAEPGDAGSLCEAILRWWAADDPVKEAIGRAAAERCRREFDWPVCVDRYLAAIGRLAR